MRTILLLIIILAFIACKPTSNKNLFDSRILEGYWIPDSVNWARPESGDPSIDTVIRYSGFQTICFDKNNKFYIFFSTQSYPVGYDSLIFEYEPGISLYKGNWNFIDSTNIIVNYRFKEGSFQKGSFKDTINIENVGNKESLLFKGSSFVKTLIYKKESLQRMDAYKNEWVPN